MKKLLHLFFKKRFSCTHKHALIQDNEGYCPECGVYLKKYFYIVRCKCCDIKRDAKMHFEEIVPSEKYCTNCGSEEFYIEKLEQINFTDVRFAVHKKETHEPVRIKETTQVWVEEISRAEQNLPPLRLIKRIEKSA